MPKSYLIDRKNDILDTFRKTIFSYGHYSAYFISIGKMLPRLKKMPVLSFAGRVSRQLIAGTAAYMYTYVSGRRERRKLNSLRHNLRTRLTPTSLLQLVNLPIIT